MSARESAGDGFPRGGGGEGSPRPVPLSGGPLVGRWARSALERLLASTGPASRVLLTGPRGAGKRHLARALHSGWHAGGRAPLEVVACDAGPEGELLARLFGREGRRPGRRGGLYWPGAFERARGGTVVVARLDAAPASAVARLGALLAVGRLLPVDGDERAAPAFGLVATARDAGAPALAGAALPFDAELAVPALAERRGDVEDLFWHFAREGGFAGFPAAAAEHFASLEWRGNVPELRRAVGKEIARWLGRFASAGRTGAEVEDAVRSAWAPRETEAGAPAEPRARRPAAASRPTKKDRILELAERVASGELAPEDAARLAGATLSYTKRILRQNS